MLSAYRAPCRLTTSISGDRPLPKPLLVGVNRALARLIAANQAQMQQQQEQLKRDREELAADRAAAQALLVAARLSWVLLGMMFVMSAMLLESRVDW